MNKEHASLLGARYMESCLGICGRLPCLIVNVVCPLIVRRHYRDYRVLKDNELQYLVNALADENASLGEMCSEAREREIDLSRIITEIKRFLESGEFQLAVRKPAGEDIELESAEAIARVEGLAARSQDWNTYLYHTPSGIERWATETWGITSERARQILFEPGFEASTKS